jgi:GNAT superfamily N-acetyltransferase
MQDVRYEVRVRCESDLAGIIRLMERVYPQDRFGPSAIWREENLSRHMDRFPEGQLVAVSSDGLIIGTSTTLLTTRDAALHAHTWNEITGHGTLSTHDPKGKVLYGVNIAVDPAWQGKGVGGALYRARIALARTLGCTAFAAGARIPGYAAHSQTMEPEVYLQAVVAGEIYDPTLSKQLKLGFSMMGLLRDYAPDPETCNHAALIVMELP